MSRTFELILDLAEGKGVIISEHGYDELAEYGIFVREILAGIAEAVVVEDYTKGSLKNNLSEFTPRFRSDLFDPKLQRHRNSGTISRTLRLRIGRRWPEDGMRKCEVIFE